MTSKHTGSRIGRRKALGLLGAAAVGSSAQGKQRTILLRSSWQTVNIGDIAHTPGMLQILKEHVPECDVLLWPGAVDRGVRAMLERAFPRLRILGRDGEGGGSVLAPDELAPAMQQADLLLHGSAASIGSQAQFEEWRRQTGKPFGFYGVGVTLKGEFASFPETTRALVDEARFVYTRETASLDNLHEVKAKAAVLGFAPDATFSMSLLDKPKAQAYMERNALKRREFLVAIPRLRFTPYERIRKVNYTAEQLKHRTEVNNRYQEADHAKMREAIVAWVRKTGHRAVIAPEMTYQIDIMDELVYDPLPADVKAKVIRRKEFWLPDEAAALYGEAATVLSFECHSPILAITQGTPCFYVHQPQDGIKGQMYRDVGLGSWYFEMEEVTGRQLADAVLQQYGRLENSLAKAREARGFARRIHGQTSREIRRAAGLDPAG